jgi:hypothetical protein
MKLHERVSQVRNKAELVEFVRALAEDLTTNRESWENPTLERYLEALASWLEDSEGYYRNQGRPVPTEPSWRDVAEMLMAAKMYE